MFDGLVMVTVAGVDERTIGVDGVEWSAKSGGNVAGVGDLVPGVKPHPLRTFPR